MAPGDNVDSNTCGNDTMEIVLPYSEGDASRGIKGEAGDTDVKAGHEATESQRVVTAREWVAVEESGAEDEGEGSAAEQGRQDEELMEVK